jgi:hypothetical protein
VLVVHAGNPLLEEALVLEDVAELLVVIVANVADFMVSLPAPASVFMMRRSGPRSMGRVAR